MILERAVESAAKADLFDSAGFFSKKVLTILVSMVPSLFLRKNQHNQAGQPSRYDSTAPSRMKGGSK